MTARDPDEAGDLTLLAYERGAALYTERTPDRRNSLVGRLINLVPRGASVLELGSGPGRDAQALEEAGLIVRRTDGASSFVDALRAAGHNASILDVRADDYGGPYDAIFANAVLLHLRRIEMASVLSIAIEALKPGGTLAASLKKGDGEKWSDDKLDDARFFTYWREADLERLLRHGGWNSADVSESTLPHSPERWITLVAQKPLQ